jgi:hypothetical protein
MKSPKIFIAALLRSASMLLFSPLPLWPVFALCQTQVALSPAEPDRQDSTIGVCLAPSNNKAAYALRIESVLPAGPASSAGLEEDDLIFVIDGHAVDSNTPVYIATQSPGTTLTVHFRRGRTEHVTSVVTENRMSYLRKIASDKPAPPNVDVASLSVDDAQRAVIALMSKATERYENVRIARDGLAFTHVWGDKSNERYSYFVSFICHAYLSPPRHLHSASGWNIDIDPGYAFYFGWNDRSDAENFVKTVNRLIWEDSPQVIGERLLQRDLLNQQVAAWRAAGTKVDPPEEARRHFVLAQEAYGEKDLKRQAEELSEALVIYPTWPDRQSDLAVSLGELGRYSEAIEHMRMYLELVPDAPDAQKAKQQIWIWQDKVAQNQSAAPTAETQPTHEVRK